MSISRIDHKNTHGFYVRVQRNGTVHSKLFSDRKYGGKDQALKLARKYERMLLEKYPPTYGPGERPLRRYYVKPGKRNKTGVVGVCRTYNVNRSGSVSPVFSVSWAPKPGAHKSTSFSIRKYGMREAFRLACQLRKQKIREIQEKQKAQQNKPEQDG